MEQNVEDLLKENVEAVDKIEQQVKDSRSISNKVADAIAEWCGTIGFAWANLIVFTVWICFNQYAPQNWRIDPYPYSFLTFMVSLEAIFLSIFILISERRQVALDEKRNKLDLQINLLSEQESTKALQLLESIADKMGVEISVDPELSAMSQTVKPRAIIDNIEKENNVAQK